MAVDSLILLSTAIFYWLIILKILDYIPPFLKNKYLLAIAGFAVWMMVFDDRDLITTHFTYKKELNQLQQSKKFYEQQIAVTRAELDQLKSNASTIEKYSREKYLMKRDNEDLFIIR